MHDRENGEDNHLIEGRHAVQEALKAGRNVEKVLIARESEQGQSVRRLMALAKDNGAVVQVVDNRKLDSLSATGHHQGVIAMGTPIQYVEPAEMLNAAQETGRPPLILALNEVTDPHNLGAILRTAEVMGAHGVVLPKHRSASLSPGTIRASAGAAAHIPIARVTNLSAFLDEMKEEGLWVTGADMDGEPLNQCDLTGPMVLVVGGESKGLGHVVRKSCDRVVSIPMAGKTGSLNASVACAILLYEIVRQRG
jgi:23S rRNA (guanosine2251-2'-O)-methyltransferase